MPATKIYEQRAVIFDPNEYLDEWDNPITVQDFITAAIKECHYCIPDDWYVNGVIVNYGTNDDMVIEVGLKRYEDRYNLQPLWKFQITSTPFEENETGDRQWVVFDVVRWQPSNLYSFQIP